MTLENTLRGFEEELLDMKTAQRLSPNVKAYYYTFTADMASGYSPITAGNVVCYRVNYSQGDNAILTEWFGEIWAATPSNNTQLIYIFAQRTLALEVYALSTRQIVSVEKINLS